MQAQSSTKPNKTQQHQKFIYSNLADHPMSSLIKKLIDLGADKKTVDQIVNKMKLMLNCAEIKLDEVDDQTEPMRKLESRMNQLYEWRTMYAAQEPEKIKKEEVQLEKERKNAL